MSAVSVFLVILDFIQDPETKPVPIQCKLDLLIKLRDHKDHQADF